MFLNKLLFKHFIFLTVSDSDLSLIVSNFKISGYCLGRPCIHFWNEF
jgi:hypothetical protein